MCTIDAPASYASWVDSICSAGVTGTAGLSFLRGSDPVIATVMMTGCTMESSDCGSLFRFAASVVSSGFVMYVCDLIKRLRHNCLFVPTLAHSVWLHL